MREEVSAEARATSTIVAEDAAMRIATNVAGESGSEVHERLDLTDESPHPFIAPSLKIALQQHHSSRGHRRPQCLLAAPVSCVPCFGLRRRASDSDAEEHAEWCRV
eukprot:1181387-Prorocentrum_minimum.AAC.1